MTERVIERYDAFMNVVRGPLVNATHYRPVSLLIVGPDAIEYAAPIGDYLRRVRNKNFLLINTQL